jgi:hypothetical protein
MPTPRIAASALPILLADSLHSPLLQRISAPPAPLGLTLLFPRSSLSAIDYRLSAGSSPLTPAFPLLARLALNHPIVYQLHATGGPWVRPRLIFIPAHPRRRSLDKAGAGWACAHPLQRAEHGSRATHSSSPPFTSHQTPVCPPLRPTHCAPASLVPKSPHCWSQKHSAAPRCLIPRADKGWGRAQSDDAQPSSASRP